MKAASCLILPRHEKSFLRVSGSSSLDALNQMSDFPNEPSLVTLTLTRPLIHSGPCVDKQTVLLLAFHDGCQSSECSDLFQAPRV